MRRIALALICGLLLACSGGDGESWAKSTYGAETAETLRQEASGAHSKLNSEPYVRKPVIIFEDIIDYPNLDRIKKTMFHNMNDGFADVASSAGQARTLVVLRKSYEYVNTEEGENRGARVDGYMVRLLDRKSKTWTNVKVADSSPRTIKKALDALPLNPKKRG